MNARTTIAMECFDSNVGKPSLNCMCLVLKKPGPGSSFLVDFNNNWIAMANALFENLLSERYIPNRQDSHIENVRPEAAFLDFFKQSLVHASPYCTDTTCCSFFNSTDLGTESERDAADCESQESSHLKYPLLLFEDLSDLPPVSDLQTLAYNFHARTLPGLRFLQKVSSLAAEHVDIPFHLLLCKALLGVEANSSQSHRPVQPLWRASVSLITGAVEVDNSLGRRLAWLTSVCAVIVTKTTEVSRPFHTLTTSFIGRSSGCFWIYGGRRQHMESYGGSEWLRSSSKGFYVDSFCGVSSGHLLLTSVSPDPLSLRLLHRKWRQCQRIAASWLRYTGS